MSMSYRSDDVGDDFCAAIIMKLSSLPCLVSIVSFKHGTEKWKQRERKKKAQNSYNEIWLLKEERGRNGLLKIIICYFVTITAVPCLEKIGTLACHVNFE